MNALTLIFLIALAASFAVEWWLMQRQKRHVLEHRDAVPAAFAERITPEAHRKAADYTLDRLRVSGWDKLLGLALTLLFTLGGGVNWLAGIWGSFALPPLAAGVGLMLSFFLLSWLLELPLSLYRTFVVEERHGFNRNTPRQYAKDSALELLLGGLIGAPLLAGVLWAMDSAGAGWWLWAWALLMGFSILMSWAFPTLIAPLFNKFTPLENATLKERIEKLLERCGFHSEGIFVMDGSRRSGHGNAYFTGFGSHKRIVFFDTLLDTLEPEEVEAVLAHELGHFKRRHVIKSLALGALMTLIGFALLGWLAGEAWFYAGLGVSLPSNAVALLLFMLISPAFTTLLQPFLTGLQRRHEFEADDFASQHARAESLVSALVKLYRDNASTLTPDPLYAAFHYSHPPASVRVGHLTGKAASS
ncbi:MAG TPA: M48 family metallopeptidase [Methylococcaceae bacterium]|nr:M48 family metallopeptidase [Methylococcaceae bacterium]